VVNIWDIRKLGKKVRAGLDDCVITQWHALTSTSLTHQHMSMFTPTSLQVHALGGPGCHRDDIISTQWMSETKLGSVGKDRKVCHALCIMRYASL